MKRRPYPYCPPFTPMVKVLEPRKKSGWELNVLKLTENDVKSARLSAAMSFSYGEYLSLRAGRYMRLLMPETTLPRIDGRMIMSDTPQERLTNIQVVERAYGDVLIAGLGIGMILLPILASYQVDRVLVLEKYQPVRDMVEPQIRRWAKKHRVDHKLEVLVCDVHDYPDRNDQQKWDIIYFDIWQTPDEKAYAETKILWKKYRRLLSRDDDRWMGAWRRKEMKKCALD